MPFVQTSSYLKIGRKINFSFQRYPNDPEAILHLPAIVIREATKFEYENYCNEIGIYPGITEDKFYEITTD